jgi:DNA polymerase III subunit delta'
MLADIVGHQAPLQVLRRAIVTDRVTHAYLFVGPPNIGKALTALQFAKALNCERHPTFASAAEVECCDECETCRRISRRIHPDYREIRPLVNLRSEEGDRAEEEENADLADDVEMEGALIGRPQISQLVTDANLKIVSARRRVYVLVSAENMNVVGANQLLKTLEEPPGDTTLILTTSSPSQLLPTVVSRCQVLTFHPVPREVAEPALLTRFPDLDPALVRTVVALSGGRIGWAHRLLQTPAAFAIRGELMDLCRDLKTMEQFDCLRLGEQIVDAVERWWRATAPDEDVAEKALKKARDRVVRTRFPDVADLLASWFRDLVLAGADSAATQVINQDRLADLQRLAPLYSPEACRKVVVFIEDLKRQLRQNANVRLSAEVLALRMLTA